MTRTDLITTNICHPMIDPHNREKLAIKALLEIREIASLMKSHGSNKIIRRIDNLFSRCGYTRIPGGNG